jgi:hypothetical protein
MQWNGVKGKVPAIAKTKAALRTSRTFTRYIGIASDNGITIPNAARILVGDPLFFTILK